MSTETEVTATITNLMWGNITVISSVVFLSGGGADIYLEDGDGDELNLELDEEAAKMLRNELNRLYPPEDDEEEEGQEVDEAEPVPAEVTTSDGNYR